MSSIEKTHTDVLQNIEFSIISVYRDDPSLLDMDALDAVRALIHHYRAEEQQHQPPGIRLAERAARVFARAKVMCEWRLGRGPLGDVAEIPPRPVSLATLIECLRRIEKSIRRWNKESGKRGYLDFIKPYLP